MRDLRGLTQTARGRYPRPPDKKRPRPRGWARSSDHPPKRMTNRCGREEPTAIPNYLPLVESRQLPVRHPSHASGAGRPPPIRGQKKGSTHEERSLMTGPKSKSTVMAEDEGGGYAVCRVGLRRGRRVQRLPGVAKPGPREEETGQINSDRLNMGPGTLISKMGGYMSAMRPLQGNDSHADRKKLGPARGESGAGVRRIALATPRRGNRRRKGGERQRPAASIGWRGRAQQSAPPQLSHALAAM